MYYGINAQGAILCASREKDKSMAPNIAQWVDQEPPQHLVSPAYISGAWVETASVVEQQQAIDRETYRAIEQWCASQGKCEQYYLNVGIQQGKDHKEYHAYAAKRAALIATAAKRKAALV